MQHCLPRLRGAQITELYVKETGNVRTCACVCTCVGARALSLVHSSAPVVQLTDCLGRLVLCEDAQCSRESQGLTSLFCPRGAAGTPEPQGVWGGAGAEQGHQHLTDGLCLSPQTSPNTCQVLMGAGTWGQGHR